jgi:hypothetical protein
MRRTRFEPGRNRDSSVSGTWSPDSLLYKGCGVARTGAVHLHPPPIRFSTPAPWFRSRGPRNCRIPAIGGGAHTFTEGPRLDQSTERNSRKNMSDQYSAVNSLNSTGGSDKVRSRSVVTGLPYRPSSDCLRGDHAGTTPDWKGPTAVATTTHYQGGQVYNCWGNPPPLRSPQKAGGAFRIIRGPKHDPCFIFRD